MHLPLTRRRFLQASTAAAGLALAPRNLRAAQAQAPAREFAFVLLGDLHLDRPEHHDMDWVRREKPNDVRQIEGYCRNTREVTPQLFATVRNTIADLNLNPATRAPFVVQVGDLVEGLCGSEELARRHNADALTLVRDAGLGAPLVFTKGNHDVTGPGAAEAFAGIFHPFLTREVRSITPAAAEVTSGSYGFAHGNAQFMFLDAYEAARSLEWFEAEVARRNAEHLFVVVHPPVVPYGARATWHVFSSAREKARRDKLLALLGDQRAIVLGGHIHKYNALARRAGKGRFTQFALSSVLTSPAAKPRTVLEGLATYTPDQIRVEPEFSSANEAERRAVYETERPFVTAFDYADLPGYAVVRISGPRVTVSMHAGTAREPWRTVDLTKLLSG